MPTPSNAEVERWIDEAKSGLEWRDRRLAVIQLSYCQDDAVIPVLLDLLNDPVSEVRHAAVIALGRLGGRESEYELRRPKTLSSSDPNIRWAAVTALGKLADHRVIDHLIPLADDEEWLVRNEALSVLKSKIGEIIAKHETKHARILIRMLSIDDPDIIEMAVEGLTSLGTDCCHLVVDALGSVKAPVRRHAARVLGLLGEPTAVGRLIDALRADPDDGVRAEAATALGRLGDEKALRPLISAMDDDDDDVRQQAVDAVVRFGRPAVEPLIHAMSYTQNKLAKTAAFRALGAIGDERAIPTLVEHLSSSYYLVRSAAVSALAEFGDRAVDPALRLLSYNRSEIGSLLEEAERGEDTEARLRAVRVLGDLEDHRAVSVLKTLLSDSNRAMSLEAQEALIRIGCAAWGRCGALAILGRSGHKEAAPRILDMLGHDSVNVRQEAVRALGQLKAQESAERLVEIARTDGSPAVRREALHVLRELVSGSEPLFQTAIDALDDESLDVRAQATRILGDFPDERAVAPLIRRLSDASWKVRFSAENALCTQGQRYIPDLVAVLDASPVIAKRRILSVLKRLGDPQAIPPIEKMLEREKDARTVSEAEEALKQLRGETARAKKI